MIIIDLIGATAWFWIKLWFITHWGFLACIQLKNMRDAGTLGKYWKAIGLPLVPIFLILDFLFNVLWGSLIYREWPKVPPFVRWEDRELLFTARCKRHYRAVAYYPNRAHSEKAMKRFRAADRWRHRLNIVDPNHIY